MSNDAQVDLIFSHFIPRYIATGVDANDLQRLIASIDSWKNWCREWSKMGAVHEGLAREAVAAGRNVTAAQAYIRAALLYHYGKHLFGAEPVEYRETHDAMMRCYKAAAAFEPRMEYLEIPFEKVKLRGWLRHPRDAAPSTKSPVAIILPGLDACKEELHEWSNAFLERGRKHDHARRPRARRAGPSRQRSGPTGVTSSAPLSTSSRSAPTSMRRRSASSAKVSAPSTRLWLRLSSRA